LTEDAPILLRPAEVARLTGLSRSKVYGLARSGDLPGVVRLGGSIRIHRATLEAALAGLAGEPREAGRARPR
jgi:excisionase family DNA binding protein